MYPLRILSLVSDLAMILAPAGPNFVGIINNITTGLRPIFTPLAGLAITFALLLGLGSPIIPEAAQQNKGFVMKALLTLIVIGIIPELVSWAATLGAAGVPAA